MKQLTIRLTDGTRFQIGASYGKMTDTVVIDTPLGTFTVHGDSFRDIVVAVMSEGMHALLMTGDERRVLEKKAGG